MEIPPKTLNKTDRFGILITLFIKKNLPELWSGKEWNRERFAGKKLLDKYNDFDFFYSMPELCGKFNSLLGLLSSKYHNLDDKYSSYLSHKEKTKKYLLSDAPVVIIEEQPKRYRNMLEFLGN